METNDHVEDLMPLRQRVDVSGSGDSVIVSVPSKKVCVSCNEEKWLESFYSNRTAKDGLQSHCKVCMNERRKLVKAGVIKSEARGVNGRRLKELKNEKLRKIAHVLIDSPSVSVEELAGQTGLKIDLVKQYLRKGEVLRALRGLGAKEVTSYIPLALRGYKDILSQRDNLSELNKVSTKILENEKIIGPNRVDVGVIEMREESTERLMQIVKEAKEFPNQVIMEAEVVE